MYDSSSIPLLEGLSEYNGRELLIFILLKIAPAILFFIVFVMLFSFAMGVLILFVSTKEGRRIFAGINAYGNLIISVLTFFLVLITAYYAYITRRILAQMIEEKHSSIRPNLLVTVANPKFHGDNYSNDEFKYFNTKARIANYGRGAAVEIQTHYSIPDKQREGDEVDMTIGTSRTHSEWLIPGGSVEDELNIPTRMFDVNKYRHYLRVQVVYEDTAQNIYQFEQLYYLLTHQIEARTPYLILESENLYVIKLKNRKHLSNDDCLNSDKKTRVFRRSLKYKL